MLLFVLFSCNNATKKKVENIKMDRVSINGDYGALIYPLIKVKKEIIKTNNYTLFIYDKESYQFIDSLFLYNDETVVFERKKLITIDTKKIKINKKNLIIKKLYVPKDRFVGSCGSGEGILYIEENGIIAFYGIGATKIIFYEPNKYSEFQKSILDSTNNFKRHKMELSVKP